MKSINHAHYFLFFQIIYNLKEIRELTFTWRLRMILQSNKSFYLVSRIVTLKTENILIFDITHYKSNEKDKSWTLFITLKK